MTSPHRQAADRAAAALQGHFGERLVTVALFGSVARGTERPGSDVDLLVVLREAPNGAFARQDLLAPALADIAADLRRTCSDAVLAPVVRTPAEVLRGGPLYYDMTVPGECVVYHDPDGFFAAFLADRRARMQAYGSVRHTAPTGHTWWDLKPDWRPGDVVDL